MFVQPPNLVEDLRFSSRNGIDQANNAGNFLKIGSIYTALGPRTVPWIACTPNETHRDERTSSRWQSNSVPGRTVQNSIVIANLGNACPG